jgi:uncharacterized protein YcsI (UPF0317 family)
MPVMTSAAELRAAAHCGAWHGTTGGHCPAYQQANLVILPQEAAVEFAASCTRNPHALFTHFFWGCGVTPR